MIAVIQRASQASVSISNQIHNVIEEGVVILLGIEESDSQEDIHWLSRKIVHLRIFNDADGVMNLSLIDKGYEALVISQFTLHASTKKGNRPSYIKAARPETAIPLYENFIEELSLQLGKPVKTGQFGANMQVSLVNDGPVTIIIDTKNKQ
jgi:D-tyrosyl-tRNA(Tyr) deacylase